MNIIFGEPAVLPDKYTILELDQFRLPPNGKIVSSYCIVEKIPLEEIPLIDNYRDLHHNCIQGFRKQQWDFCEQSISALRGRWNKELDSFYENLLQRISQLKNQTLSADWDGVIDKTQNLSPCTDE